MSTIVEIQAPDQISVTAINENEYDVSVTAPSIIDIVVAPIGIPGPAGPTGPSGGVWGEITGDLEEQIDLGTTYHPTLSTGIRSGGILSINSPDDSKFKISAGYGGFNRIVAGNFIYTPVTWNEMVVAGDMSGIATRHSLHVFMDKDGIIYQENDKPTIDEYPQYIYFGVIAVVPSTNKVASVYQFQSSSYMASMRIRHLLYALGAFNITGNIYSANGNNLKIDRTEGSIVRAGSNYGNNPEVQDIMSCPAASAETFFQPYHSSGNWAYAAIPSPNIDPDYYDNLTNLTIVPDGYWTVKPIFYYQNVRFIQYGQTLYATKFDALNHMRDAFQKHPILTPEDFVLRGYIIVKKGCTFLNDTASCEFREEGKFGVGSAIAGETQAGLPPGGSTNQALKKIGNADFDIAWVTDDVPFGLTKEIQFNDGGVFGSDANFLYDKDLQSLSVGKPNIIPDNPLALGGSVDSYIQSNIQNKSDGISASADYIITADDGSDTDFYADMGLSNSNYDVPEWDISVAHDGYFWVDGGNAIIGSMTPGKDIKFFVANVSHEAHPIDLIATMNTSGLNMYNGMKVRENGFNLSDLIMEANGATAETAAFAAGAKICIRTDLI
jgi:hypothetical protein